MRKLRGSNYKINKWHKLCEIKGTIKTNQIKKLKLGKEKKVIIKKLK